MPTTDPPADPLDCPDCHQHCLDDPFLVSAAASVGISHGTDTNTTLRRYLAAFHRRGHRDETGGRGRG